MVNIKKKENEKIKSNGKLIDFRSCTFKLVDF